MMYLRGELVGQHNESRGHLDCRGMLLSPSTPRCTRFQNCWLTRRHAVSCHMKRLSVRSLKRRWNIS